MNDVVGRRPGPHDGLGQPPHRRRAGAGPRVVRRLRHPAADRHRPLARRPRGAARDRDRARRTRARARRPVRLPRTHRATGRPPARRQRRHRPRHRPRVAARAKGRCAPGPPPSPAGGSTPPAVVRSPYTVDGKPRLFAEPPHMQASLLLLPKGARVPAVGRRGRRPGPLHRDHLRPRRHHLDLSATPHGRPTLGGVTTTSSRGPVPADRRAPPGHHAGALLRPGVRVRVHPGDGADGGRPDAGGRAARPGRAGAPLVGLVLLRLARQPGPGRRGHRPGDPDRRHGRDVRGGAGDPRVVRRPRAAGCSHPSCSPPATPWSGSPTSSATGSRPATTPGSSGSSWSRRSPSCRRSGCSWSAARSARRTRPCCGRWPCSSTTAASG